MRFIKGIACIIAGFFIWCVSVVALISWLAFCFGSVIVGILLLIFAPYILLAPLAIGTPGTALFVVGMGKLANVEED